MVRLSKDELALIKFSRVARIATGGERNLHVVPVCAAFDGKYFYIATESQTRKVKNIQKTKNATLIFDEYSEDWGSLRGVMLQCAAKVIRDGAVFKRGKELLEKKFQQYGSFFAIKAGRTVILQLKPKRIASWNYAKQK